MFEVVARANIHHQQVLNLLKQRAKIHASFLYETERISSLEQSLLAHIYALLDAEQDQLKPQVAALVSALKVLTETPLTIEELIKEYQTSEMPEALLQVLSLLPPSYIQTHVSHSFESSDLEDVLYRNNELLELLIYVDIEWPAEMLQIARQSTLAKQYSPTQTAACLMWEADNVSSQELAQGYAHENVHIAQASFVKGLSVDTNNAQQALFNRFAKTTDVPEKVALLLLAGLSGDIRWVEPCTVFCKEYPEHTFEVLSHFQHKCFLPMVIQLMATAQSSEQAYQAWLLLTNQALQSMPQLQDVSGQQSQTSLNDLTDSTEQATIPNNNHAELIRQQLMQQQGSRILAGVSFDAAWQQNQINHQLSNLQGKALQGVLMLSAPVSNKSTASRGPQYANAMPLYRSQLSSNQFLQLTQPQAANVNTGAEHVA